jgi:hypothetical protein
MVFADENKPQVRTLRREANVFICSARLDRRCPQRVRVSVLAKGRRQ